MIGLGVLLVINTVVVNSETKDAEATIDGGQILSLPGGDVQVLEEGPARGRPDRAPALLLVLAALVGRAGADPRDAATA